MGLLFLVSAFIVFLSSSHQLSFCAAGDRLAAGQSVLVNQTILSAHQIFALGFFTAEKSDAANLHYAGIWYNRLPERTVVWVANRERPLRDPAGLLTVTEDGNIAVLDGMGRTVWSTNLTGVPSNASAVLLHSGNLVLRDGNNNDVWQSFDHPADTLLPGMILRSNLSTGVSTRLTSWRSAADPSPGQFVYITDPKTSIQQYIFKGSEILARARPWDGKVATTFQQPGNTNNLIVRKTVKGDDEISWDFYMVTNSMFGRFVLDYTGKVNLLISVESWHKWVSVRSFPERTCDFYNRCGPFGVCDHNQSSCRCLDGFEPKSPEEWKMGNFTGGCVRRLQLRCNGTDRFVKVPGMKLPDGFSVMWNKSMQQCETECSARCHCQGYAYADITNLEGKVSGSRCLIWVGEMKDLGQIPDFAEDLYVRLHASELAEGNTTRLEDGIFLMVKRRTRMIVPQQDLDITSALGSTKEMSDAVFFDFKIVRTATSDFCSENKLGEGGFGPVYKGTLLNGQEIAVKRLSKGSKQGHQEFHNEVTLIARLQHKNLVRLLGWCIHKDEKILIYEYMSNKSLDKFVFGFGYMSPEYALNGVFSEKSDVFSFGVILLEIITGKRSTGFYPDRNFQSLFGYERMNGRYCGEGYLGFFFSSYPRVKAAVDVGLAHPLPFSCLYVTILTCSLLRPIPDVWPEQTKFMTFRCKFLKKAKVSCLSPETGTMTCWTGWEEPAIGSKNLSGVSSSSFAMLLDSGSLSLRERNSDDLLQSFHFKKKRIIRQKETHSSSSSSRGDMGLFFLVSAFIVVLSSSHQVSFCAAGDRLAAGQYVSVNQTVLSASQIFTLGFFKAEKSDAANLHYAGIWYNRLPRTVVWVANRERPLRDPAGVLTATEDGNIAVLDGMGRAVWSTNLTGVPSNTSAVLLDSGNLILRQGDGNDVWQSFDHPADTLLPGMKLRSNLSTGVSTRLTSWRGAADPSPGQFVLIVDPKTSVQQYIFKGSEILARMRPWDGKPVLRFQQPGSTITLMIRRIVKGDDEISWTFYMPDNYSVFGRFVLDYAGQVDLLVWGEWLNKWISVRPFPAGTCDFYNRCGPFGVCDRNQDSCRCLDGFEPKSPEEWKMGNFTGGCVRGQQLRCNGTDRFVKVPGMKLPDGFSVMWNKSMQQCETECTARCHCQGYAYADITTLEGKVSGSRCLIWDGEMKDLVQISDYAEDLYVRLHASEDEGNNTRLEDGIFFPSKNKGLIKIIVPTLSLGMLLIGICCYFSIKMHKSRVGKRRTRMIVPPQSLDIASALGSAKEVSAAAFFDFKIVKTATSDFCGENKLGEGGFGPVYKGTLLNGQEIAVKRLSKSSKQGHQEFHNEVTLIARLQHNNLVRLLGWCIHKDEKILIYEFMSNKSLDKFVFGFGYMSPEYAFNGVFSEKSDVFSFGVILLEIITGKRSTDFYPDSNFQSLFGYAWQVWESGRALELLDPSISGSSSTNEVLRCTQLAMLCIQDHPADRPTMSSIISLLSNDVCPLPMPKKPAFVIGSTPFNSVPPSSLDGASKTSSNQLTRSSVQGR
ncbi:hypothetical protein Taro_025589 [Colocasia esculenta]|uniref:non-specific serine/threonine protein kinase n=1 Tax=Colocasia esculenta TaxID=4460 RepID=A0A843VI14_COLES|nr:hypothetical protein [Colocasia esculenta]